LHVLTITVSANFDTSANVEGQRNELQPSRIVEIHVHLKLEESHLIISFMSTYKANQMLLWPKYDPLERQALSLYHNRLTVFWVLASTHKYTILVFIDMLNETAILKDYFD